MNKNIVYVVVGIAVLAIGGYAMLGMNENNKSSVDNSSEISIEIGENTATSVESGESSSSLLAEYLKTRIGNIKCILHMEEEGGTVDQTVYISGLQMRMDATVTHDGGTFDSHMINDGDYTYIWGAGGSFKMKNDIEDVIQEGEDKSDVSDFGDENDLEKILEKMPENECEKWKVDKTKFKLPEGVEFQEFSDGFKLDSVDEVTAEQVEDLENNPYENLPDIDKLKEMIPDELKDNKYMEQMEDKLPSQSGL